MAGESACGGLRPKRKLIPARTTLARVVDADEGAAQARLLRPQADRLGAEVVIAGFDKGGEVGGDGVFAVEGIADAASDGAEPLDPAVIEDVGLARGGVGAVGMSPAMPP